jgi:hypothetical protein
MIRASSFFSMASRFNLFDHQSMISTSRAAKRELTGKIRNEIEK